MPYLIAGSIPPIEVDHIVFDTPLLKPLKGYATPPTTPPATAIFTFIVEYTKLKRRLLMPFLRC